MKESEVKPEDASKSKPGETAKGPQSKTAIFVQYLVSIILFTVLIGVFSLFMLGVVNFRDDISEQNYSEVSQIYRGPLKQSSPILKEIDASDSFYINNSLTPDIIRKSLDNTFLKATDAKVVLTTDYVKKGLVYQPSYKTAFAGKFILENSSDVESFVKFEFPLPSNYGIGEISNAKLIVDGKEITDAKSTSSATNSYTYIEEVTNVLLWTGKVEPKKEFTVEVSYDTVGLSYFQYDGIENSKRSQDFKFDLTINGTRAYNVVNGLSVSERVFGDNSVQLLWDKENLYSKPAINVSIGDKLNPSEQVSRVYFVMTPVYFVFMSILCYLAYKFSKRFTIFDIGLISVLFTVFFPLMHYISGFTIDPTMEVFASVANVGFYSMPLYLAFLIAWIIVGALMYYLIGKLTDFKFANKIGIPMLILFLGFFPLVVTIPEYSVLLMLVGVVALIAIAIQTRIKLLKS